MHWRELALDEMGRALATGRIPEQLAAVSGFDVETVKPAPSAPAEFNGRHPTERRAPGQERFYR